MLFTYIKIIRLCFKYNFGVGLLNPKPPYGYVYTN